MNSIPASRRTADARFIDASRPWKFSGGADGMATRNTRKSRSRNAVRGYHASMTQTLRIAAAGDVHAGGALRERLTRVFRDVASDCRRDPARGRPDDARATRAGGGARGRVRVPTCTGRRRPRQPRPPLRPGRGGHERTRRRRRASSSIASHTILEIGDLEIGIVGTKGFVGGFPGAEIPDFGEPAATPDLPGDVGRGRGARAGAGGDRRAATSESCSSTTHPSTTRSSASRSGSGPSSGRAGSPARSGRTARSSSCTGTRTTGRQGLDRKVPVTTWPST